MTHAEIPSPKDLYDPIVEALRSLGGEGSRKDVIKIVAEMFSLSPEQMNERVPNYANKQFEHNVDNAKRTLQNRKSITSSDHGIWRLTDEDRLTADADPSAVRRVAERVKNIEDANKYSEESAESKMNKSKKPVSIPTLDKMMSPLLLVLHRLGGSGTNDEMHNGVVKILRLTDAQLELLHESGRGTQTEVEYRLSVARRYLKKYGLLENPKPKTWKLTAKGSTVVRVNPYAVILYYREKTWEESMRRDSEILPELTDIDDTMSW